MIYSGGEVRRRESRGIVGMQHYGQPDVASQDENPLGRKVAGIMVCLHGCAGDRGRKGREVVTEWTYYTRRIGMVCFFPFE